MHILLSLERPELKNPMRVAFAMPDARKEMVSRATGDKT